MTPATRTAILDIPPETGRDRVSACLGGGYGAERRKRPEEIGVGRDAATGRRRTVRPFSFRADRRAVLQSERDDAPARWGRFSSAATAPASVDGQARPSDSRHSIKRAA